ncbi:hypothetical protein [Blastopirellula marina]|uniref:Uncharacterized protein n=1 Tax=Blastopirellula marina TaxID=124 RepID=A0A2S8GHY2_9BACT|nr:hypothetical protein [Blastopirellula marina]PQO44046.1 hypothetical protein C5Y93_21125 [Blastopirellula marina]
MDVSLDNESTLFFISNGSSQRAIKCDVEGLKQACEQEQLIVQMLDQDDGIIARVVLGKLNKKEEEEWIEQGVRILDLNDGMLVLAGGNSFVSSQSSEEEFEDEADYFQQFLVRPGRYKVTVYTHAPCINGFRLTRRADWQGFLPYFATTRPRKKYPGWLIEYANLDGEDVDAIPAKKVDMEEEEFLGFLVHLELATDSTVQSKLTNGYVLETESRLPERCPVGIVAIDLEDHEPMSEEEFEREEAIKHEARFGDPDQLAKRFTPFAEALFQKDFATAADFFIPELREAVESYMNVKRNRRDRWEPLADVWLDKQNAGPSINSWRSNFELQGNLFAPDFVDETNYLGDVRCEYGNGDDFVEGKIRRYLIVDAPIIATADGPKLAGLYFSD